MVPTRELAVQIIDVIKELGRFTPITVAGAVRQDALITANILAHVVVGTPGTVLTLIRRKLLDVSQLRMFALDEADTLLDLQSLGGQTMNIKR